MTELHVPEPLFQINGVTLWAPTNYQETPIPVVGYNLRGEPIRQGFPSMVFTWDLMTQERLTALFAQYDPNNPQVQVTYIDKQVGSRAAMLRSAPTVPSYPASPNSNVLARLPIDSRVTVLGTHNATWMSVQANGVSGYVLKAHLSNYIGSMATVVFGEPALVTKFGMMEEPVVGGRSIIYYQNIALKFTRLTDVT